MKIHISERRMGLIKGFFLNTFFCNLRAFIQEEKLCLKCLIAIPPVIANAKHRDKLLLVSNCPNCVVSKIKN